MNSKQFLPFISNNFAIPYVHNGMKTNWQTNPMQGPTGFFKTSKIICMSISRPMKNKATNNIPNIAFIEACLTVCSFATIIRRLIIELYQKKYILWLLSYMRLCYSNLLTERNLPLTDQCFF